MLTTEGTARLHTAHLSGAKSPLQVVNMSSVDDLAFCQPLILKSSAAGWSLAETSRVFCLEKHIASRNSVAADVSRVFSGNEK